MIIISPLPAPVPLLALPRYFQVSKITKLKYDAVNHRDQDDINDYALLKVIIEIFSFISCERYYMVDHSF